MMRLRLLPVLLLAAGLTLMVKLGAIWEGFGSLTEIPRAVAAEDGGKAAEAGPAKPMVKPEDAKMAKAGEEPGPDGKIARLPTDVFSLSDEEIELLQRLAERRAEIERQVSVLEERKDLLEAAERRVDEKIVELNNLRATIEALLVQHDEQEESQMKSLVKIYESMKPKDAARIFEQLDLVVLLDVIERMKERKTAPILAQMNPERAKEITLELAQRRELPKQSGKP